MRTGVAVFAATVAMACTPAPAEMGLPAGRELAMPAATGAAGPFHRAVVTLTRAKGRMRAPFTGELRAETGTLLALAGPDEPGDFFLLDPRAILFAPVDRSGRNGVVILYDSSQIGPGNGTQARALAFRIDARAATRQPAAEARLSGVTDPKAARARLEAMLR